MDMAHNFLILNLIDDSLMDMAHNFLILNLIDDSLIAYGP
jgi:hypothetical protein